MAVVSAKEMAAALVRQAPDPEWLRELTDRLDRHVRTAPLERLTTLWGLSGAEAARAFGVSRQAFAKWLDNGVPSGRAEAVADLAAATDELDRRVERERIPAVVRRKAEALGGGSLYELACEGRHAEVREKVAALVDPQPEGR